MKLPQDTIIAEAKITHYLFRKQQINDKSQFLARAGYCLETANKLEQHLREQILSLEATYSNSLSPSVQKWGYNACS